LTFVVDSSSCITLHSMLITIGSTDSSADWRCWRLGCSSRSVTHWLHLTCVTL